MDRASDTGEAVMRVYGWTRPTLSFGRNQPARGLYDADRADADGVDIVRRPTGGRAVLHYREITYSVTAPAGALGRARESYEGINRLLLEGLRRLGVDASAHRESGRAPRPSLTPCFATPVAGEIVFEGRKLVGSAQWHANDALLQHGSILLDDDQDGASRYLLAPAAASAPPATLRGALGWTPSSGEVAAALEAAVVASGAEVSPLTMTDTLNGQMSAHRARYEDDSWTWRR